MSIGAAILLAWVASVQDTAETTSIRDWMARREWGRAAQALGALRTKAPLSPEQEKLLDQCIENGTWIVCAARDTKSGGSLEEHFLYLVRPDGSHFHRCPGVSRAVYVPRWGPSPGKLTYVGGEPGHLLPWTLGPKGGPEEAVKLIGWESDFCTAPYWDRGGTRMTWLRRSKDQTDLLVSTIGAGTPQILVSRDGLFRNPTLSPDAGRIAITTNWDRLALRPPGVAGHTGVRIENQIWVLEVQTGKGHRLTQGDGIEYDYPSWSPDGRELAVETMIWKQDAARPEYRIAIGDVATGRFTPLPGWKDSQWSGHEAVAWSLSGKDLLVPLDDHTLHRVNRSTGTWTRLTPEGFAVRSPSWSDPLDD